MVFSSRRRHTRCLSDWSSDVCSSDLKRCLAHAQRLLPAFPRQRQTLGAVETKDLLVIDDVAVSPQEDCEPSIAETRPLLRQLAQLRPNLLVGRPPGLVSPGGSPEPDKTAAPRLAPAEFLNHDARRSPLRDGRHHFFPSTPLSAAISRACSATMCLRRRFSSSSCLSFLASLTSIPPYFAFQR